MTFLWLVVVGAIAGWLAGRIMRGHGFGLIGDIIVGVIGSFLGRYLLRTMKMEIGHGLLGILIVAFIGAMLLLFVVRLFTGRREGRRLWS